MRLIGETTAPHWPYLRRVMGEVLRDDEQMPQTILGEHVAILDAIIAGDGDACRGAEPRSHLARGKDFRTATASAARGVRTGNASAAHATSAVNLANQDLVKQVPTTPNTVVERDIDGNALHECFAAGFAH